MHFRDGLGSLGSLCDADGPGGSDLEGFFYQLALRGPQTCLSGRGSWLVSEGLTQFIVTQNLLQTFERVSG